MGVWQCCISNEGKNLFEWFWDLGFSHVLKIQMQVLEVRVRIGKIIFTRVRNVEDMRDSQRLNNMCITCVVPVTKVKTSRKDFIWIVVGLSRPWNTRLALRIYAKMFVYFGNFIEALDTEVELAQSLVFQRFKEETCVPHRKIVLLFFLCLECSYYFRQLFFVSVSSHFEQKFINIFTILCANNETPVPPALFKAVDLIFVLENRETTFELLAYFGPLCKTIFFKFFQRKIDWFWKVHLAEQRLRSHIENECDIFVVVHIANLLVSSDSDLERLL